MKQGIYILAYILLGLFIISTGIIIAKSNETSSPEKTIENLYKAIGKAQERGEYGCCIEPPCTMCFLGKWKFEKGTCYCDEAIREGRTEDVCPECKAGLEKGLCKSGTQCLLDENIYGGKQE